MQALASPAKYSLNFLIRGEANIPHDVFTGLLERSFKNHIINGASVGKACFRRDGIGEHLGRAETALR